VRIDLKQAAAAWALVCAGAVSGLAQSGGASATAPKPAAASEPAPRWPDGHVNLGSTPDKKGYWEVRPGLGGMPRPDGIPFQPWAKALYEYRSSKKDLYPPLVGCKPAGGPSFFNAPGFEIVDAPELKSIFILDIAGPHSWRVIYMDGRGHPQDLDPSYFGHSVGHWEGDSLVVDSVGFNERFWLTREGIPHTSALHLVERFTRTDYDTLKYEATIDDPGAYTSSWTGGWNIRWQAGEELYEYVCQDNNRDPKHMYGGER